MHSNISHAFCSHTVQYSQSIAELNSATYCLMPTSKLSEYFKLGLSDYGIHDSELKPCRTSCKGRTENNRTWNTRYMATLIVQVSHNSRIQILAHLDFCGGRSIDDGMGVCRRVFSRCHMFFDSTGIRAITAFSYSTETVKYLVTIDVVGLLGVYSCNAHHKIGSKSQCKLLLQTNYHITAEKVYQNNI